MYNWRRGLWLEENKWWILSFYPLIIIYTVNQKNRTTPKGCCYITGDSAQWLHHKTDFALTSFPFIRKPILCRLWQKILQFYLFNSWSERNCETRSFYHTFLEICKHRSVMQPLQNPPFCSSTPKRWWRERTWSAVMQLHILADNIFWNLW